MKNPFFPIPQGAAFYIFLSASAAWSLAIGSHELLGHGGVCALDPGCNWVSANAMYFNGHFTDNRFEGLWRASGSLINLIMGALALFWLGRATGLLALFLWQFAAVSFINQGSYIAFGWAIDPGMDWSVLVAGAPDPDLARKLVITVGVSLVLFALWVLSRRAVPTPGGHRHLVIWSMAGFAATALTASALVPTDARLFMLMGGLGSGLFFMSPMALLAFRPGVSAGPFQLRLGPAALCLGVTGLYLLVLGPEIVFAS